MPLALSANGIPGWAPTGHSSDVYQSGTWTTYCALLAGKPWPDGVSFARALFLLQPGFNVPRAAQKGGNRTSVRSIAKPFVPKHLMGVAPEPANEPPVRAEPRGSTGVDRFSFSMKKSDRDQSRSPQSPKAVRSPQPPIERHTFSHGISPYRSGVEGEDDGAELAATQPAFAEPQERGRSRAMSAR